MLRTRWCIMAATACLATLAYWPVARAQVDLTGSWSIWIDQDNKIRGAGPDPGTFLGVPLNAAARAAALAYTPEDLAMLDRQCLPWPVHYLVVGPFPMDFWPTKRLDGSILAWNMSGVGDRLPVTIWMDGRPPPSPGAAHSLGGFTTGRWLGATLVTTTTNIADGDLTRNGAPNSDQEVFTMFITRHDDFLNITGIVHDPLYLTEPYVLSDVFTAGPKIAAPNPFATGDPNCQPEEEESGDTYRVPSYLTPAPETAGYATKNYGIPEEAAHGGAESMYPEYIKKIQPKYKRPQGYCTLDCCGEQGATGNSQEALNFNIRVLKCKQDNP